MVMKLALVAAVHAQLDVTGIDPVAPATLTSFVTGTPAVTGHGDEGAVSFFEQAAAASAAVAATTKASNSAFIRFFIEVPLSHTTYSVIRTPERACSSARGVACSVTGRGLARGLP
jgi:hypothetical protein